MALYDFSISGIRGPVNSEGLGWATLAIQLALDTPEAYPEIEIDVPFQFDQSQSVEQMRATVLAGAIKLLDEARSEMAKGLSALDAFVAEKLEEEAESAAMLEDEAA
jgi:hypothetical protein